MSSIETGSFVSRFRSDPLQYFPVAGALSGLISFALHMELTGIGSNSDLPSVTLLGMSSAGPVLGCVVATLIYVSRAAQGWRLLACMISCYVGWHFAYRTGLNYPAYAGMLGSPIGSFIAYFGVMVALPATRNFFFPALAIVACTLYGVFYDFVEVKIFGTGEMLILYIIWQAIFCFAVAVAVKTQIDPKWLAAKHQTLARLATTPAGNALAEKPQPLVLILISGLALCWVLSFMLNAISHL